MKKIDDLFDYFIFVNLFRDISKSLRMIMLECFVKSLNTVHLLVFLLIMPIEKLHIIETGKVLISFLRVHASVVV